MLPPGETPKRLPDRSSGGGWVTTRDGVRMTTSCSVESRARELLRDPRRTLVDIALSVGFQSQAHFTTVFRRFTGAPPHRWRRLMSGQQSLEQADVLHADPGHRHHDF